jgi:diguanylate cyclase (GGDEF)-like protein
VRVSALIDSVERYKGAVDFVSQMLDVDFVAAVSFVRPFDQNFHDLMQSLDSLVHDVQARERSDADDALTSAIHTTRAFEAVVAGCILIALLAAANMRLAAVRSQRLARQNSALTRLTQIDPLTGLANRRCFDDTLQRSWQECLEKQAPLCLVMFDVDHFKKFNDSQGHQAGDSCLRQVAAAVVPCTRGVSDLAARYGGEEFAVIMPSLPLAAGRSAAERIRLAVLHCAIPHPAAGPPGIVTISIGVASLVPTMAGSPTDLIEAADRSLYAAKRAGRNRVGDVVQGARPTQAAAPRPAHSESQHHD